MSKINTATGAITASDLGPTLMHEHVYIAMAGHEADTLHPGPADREIVAKGVDTVAELKRRGIASFVDPLPGNMGRRVDLVAEIAARTSFNIICATGLFAEKYGANAYWLSKLGWLKSLGRGQEYHRYLADVFINEIVNGVDPARIKCGVIKVASTTFISEFEMETLKAAALASIETGAPITTHSDDGLLGREQQRVLLELGVPPHRIVIGHSCNTTDHEYHTHIVRRGSYIGFDRFGFQVANSDENRIDSLLKLLRLGAAPQVVISNDSCACWGDRFKPFEDSWRKIEETWNAFRVTDVIIPELKRRGVSDAELNLMLVENPRRYFAHDPIPPDGLPHPVN